jgi:hypothetical protein
MSKYIDVPPANYDPPAKPPSQGCEHKWVFMETVKQRGERASFGISPQKEWKRTDRFYCEKCLEIKEIVKTEYGYMDKPDWFD